MPELSPEPLEIPDPRAPMKEVLSFFDAHPELMTQEHLNNFHLYLPGSMTRESLEDDILDAIPNSNQKYKSPKRLQQTLRQYLQEIDQAVIDSDIDIDKLKEINRAKDQASLEERLNDNIRLRDQLHELVLPVYRLLRERGYNTYDIIS